MSTYSSSVDKRERVFENAEGGIDESRKEEEKEERLEATRRGE